MAGLLTLAFVAYLSLFTALCAYGYARCHRLRPWAFASLWTACEWMRSHALTGFPWLLVGYTQTHGPLQSLAPWLGIYGVSFCTALLAALLMHAGTQSNKHLAIALLSVATLLALPHRHWTTPIDAQTVRLVQGNVVDKWHTSIPSQWQRYWQRSETTRPTFVIWPGSPTHCRGINKKPLKILETIY